MEIRELSVAEVKMVSGAAAPTRNMWTGYDDYIAGMNDFKAQAMAIDSSKPWEYVAATHPDIKDKMAFFISDFGLGGKETIAAWSKRYA